jgi:hypothetical protein
VEIRALLREAQQGQVYANLAQAFHLAPPKVEAAVHVMIDDLIGRIEANLESRQALVEMVELLGKGGYELVLQQPSLLGATHTQVIGNEALNVLAGHGEIKNMTRDAATAGDISEMIAEYLLPVAAVLLVAALARLSRDRLEDIMGHTREENQSGGADGTAEAAQHLPLVAGGIGFSGSTGGTFGPLDADSASHYVELAQRIKRAEGRPPASDPAIAVRKVIASCLGYGPIARDWFSRVQSIWLDVIKTAFAGPQR